MKPRSTMALYITLTHTVALNPTRSFTFTSTLTQSKHGGLEDEQIDFEVSIRVRVRVRVGLGFGSGLGSEANARHSGQDHGGVSG